MKISLLLPVIILPALYPHSTIHFQSFFQADTTAIIHVLDGNISEWPAEKFTISDATKIHYAIDNNDQTLFLAIKIPENAMQKKIMQQGLSLFIDTKAKKKENHGVEFPLKTEYGANIESMRVFGFDNSSESAQSLRTNGTINIAIQWDSSFAMNIEYYIPLKMLDKSVTELNNKKISIGWKIDEPDMPSGSQPVSTTSRVVAVTVPSSGSRPTNNRNTALPSNNNTFPQTSSSKSRSFWTTHTIIF